jgi:hypothetical protein
MSLRSLGFYLTFLTSDFTAPESPLLDDSDLNAFLALSDEEE